MTVASSEAKPHSHGKYLAVITLLALLVVALGGAAGYYYMNRTTVQAAKTAPPTLTTTLHAQEVSFTPWFNTAAQTTPCSNGNGIPALGGLNFTENLSGRDPGSTWIQFKGNDTGLWVFNKADLKESLLTEFICTGGTSLRVLAEAQALVSREVPSSTMWRVPASGGYTSILEGPTGFATFGGALPPTNVVANETWTVTTISTD